MVYDPRMNVLLLLVACQTKAPPSDTVLPGDTADTGAPPDTGTPPPEDLGDPYLGLVAPIPRGILSSDCVMRAEVYTGEALQFTVEINPALGGEWAGAGLDGGVQYKVKTYHSTCTEQTPEETEESGTFSGVAGLLFLYWFNGTNSGVEAMEQTVDFSGGSAFVTLAKGTDPTELETVAGGLGVTVAPGTEADSYVLTFPTELPVGQVLAEVAAVEGFLEGSPDWIVQPGWW